MYYYNYHDRYIYGYGSLPLMVGYQECPTYSSLPQFMVFGFKYVLPYSLGVRFPYSSLAYSLSLCFSLSPSLPFHFMVYGFPLYGYDYG